MLAPDSSLALEWGDLPTYLTAVGSVACCTESKSSQHRIQPRTASSLEGLQHVLLSTTLYLLTCSSGMTLYLLDVAVCLMMLQWAGPAFVLQHLLEQPFH